MSYADPAKVAAGLKAARRRMVTVRAPALAGQDFAPVNWIVEGLIPEGLTLLAGKPKLGKSWLMLDVAVAVAGGGRVLGRDCRQGEVLYAALEDNPRRLGHRLRQLAPKADAPHGLHLTTEIERLEDGGLDDLRDWIAAAETPRLVIIDVFAKVRRVRAGNENLYDADYAATASLKALADETGVAVVVVHHTRKQAAEDDPLDAVSGSTGLTASTDTNLVLTRDAEGVTLYVRGRDVEEAELAVRFDAEACRWEALGQAGRARMSDERKAVLEALAGADGPRGPSEIALANGLDPINVRQLMHRMAKAGEIGKAGRGLYLAPCHIGHPVTSQDELDLKPR